MLKKSFLIVITIVGITLTFADNLIKFLDLCEFTGISICSEPIEPCSSEADTIKCVKHLFSNPNQANLQVKILPNPSLKLKQKMQMRFISQKQGQLLVFDINTQGALTQLMPNQYSDKQFKLEANKDFIIPENTWGFDLHVKEPLGNGILLTILIEDEIDLKSILPVSFQELKAEMAKVMLQHLHDQLNNSIMLNGVLRHYKWSGVFSDYQITQ